MKTGSTWIGFFVPPKHLLALYLLNEEFVTKWFVPAVDLVISYFIKVPMNVTEYKDLTHEAPEDFSRAVFSFGQFWQWFFYTKL